MRNELMIRRPFRTSARLVALAAIVVTTSLLTGHTLAQPAQPTRSPACSSALFHELEFWLGEWQVRTAAGQLAGRSSVRLLAGGCAVLEEWDGQPGPQGGVYRGAGIHVADPRTNSWQQTFADSRPVRTVMTGKMEGNVFVYRWMITDPRGRTVPKRYTLSTIAGGVRQLGERSDDGGITWTAEYDYRYSKS